MAGAQALLGSPNPGACFNIVIVDTDDSGHGAYTANIAGADVGHTQNGEAFPGIAPGANTSIIGFSQDHGHVGDRAWDGLMGIIAIGGGGQEFYEDHVAADNLARGLDETFNNAITTGGSCRRPTATTPSRCLRWRARWRSSARPTRASRARRSPSC